MVIGVLACYYVSAAFFLGVARLLYKDGALLANTIKSGGSVADVCI
jgi:hypothetical protein